MTAPDLFGASPFDAIRQTRDDGTECWSARELMPMLTYPTWQHFRPVIDRAEAAAENQGIDLESNFTVVREVSGQRGPAREDVHLSRFAAYLVAMNGDPRKPEVAAAQAYFAVKTREAEVSPAVAEAERIAALPKSALLTIAAEQAERAEKAEAELAIAAPKAEAFEAFLSTTGDYSVNEAAKILSRDFNILTGEKRLRDWMLDNGWIYRDGSRKPRAYQTRIDQGVLAEKAQWHYHPTSGEKVTDTPQVRVTPKGIERLRGLLGGAAA